MSQMNQTCPNAQNPNDKVKLSVINKRGNNIKIMLSIANMECGEVIQLAPAPLGNMAMIWFRFLLNTKKRCELLSSISVKRADNAKNHIIGVKVFGQGFEKHWICSDDWTEFVKIGNGIPTHVNIGNCIRKTVHPFLDTIQLTIKVDDITPRNLSVNKKLLEDATFTDFNLKAEDGLVAVHKAVLGIQSDVFLAMLNREWTETTEGTIAIPGVTMKTLLQFKDYMYLRALPNDTLQLQQLLQIGSCYMIDTLKTDCITKLLDMLTPENFDSIVEFACQNNMPDLMKAMVTDTPDNIAHGIQMRKKLASDVSMT